MAAILKLYGTQDARNIDLDIFQYFRIGSNGKETVNLRCGDEKYDLIIELIEKTMVRSKLISGKTLTASIIQCNEELLRVIINDEMHEIRYFVSENRISIWSKQLGKFIFNLEPRDQINDSAEQNLKDFNGRIIASMPCKINQIMVRSGDRVQIGSPLCVTEAMKMEVLYKKTTIQAYYF